MNCQSDVEQLDLFGGADLSPPPELGGEVLNGMYYEQSTRLFVSYVLGRRHFEVTPAECLGDKEWQKQTMKERAI